MIFCVVLYSVTEMCFFYSNVIKLIVSSTSISPSANCFCFLYSYNITIYKNRTGALDRITMITFSAERVTVIFKCSDLSIDCREKTRNMLWAVWIYDRLWIDIHTHITRTLYVRWSERLRKIELNEQCNWISHPLSNEREKHRKGHFIFDAQEQYTHTHTMYVCSTGKITKYETNIWCTYEKVNNRKSSPEKKRKKWTANCSY